MKIGVSSYSFAKYLKATNCNYLDICDKAKEMGFDGIEFVQLELYPFAMLGTAEETAVKIREHCKEIGLEICAYTVSVNLLFNADEEFKKLIRYIDQAELLGAKIVRHDLCYSLPKKYLYTYRDAIKDMLPKIKEATEYAKAKGIKTCSENHGYIFQAPERLEELILAVGDENYGWLCDFGNFLDAEADIVKAVTIAANYTFHVHVKDCLFVPGVFERPIGFGKSVGGNYIRGTVVGHGVVPVNQCINILKASGYDGYLSVEFEGMEECLPAIDASLKYLQKLI